MGSRRWVAVVTLALLSIALAACARPVGEASAARAGDRIRLRVSGSGTCLPLLRLLSEQYQGPEISFVFLPGLHSAGGIRGVAAGDLEIGAVSRDLTADERVGVRYHPLAKDALAIAVNPSVGVGELTTEQVRDIYAGRYTDWSQLGGSKLPIVVCDRNEDESAKIAMRRSVLGPLLKVTPRAVTFPYEPDMVEAVATQPGAIGYFSYGYAVAQRVNARFLPLNGVPASIENVASGKYTMYRTLGFVTDPGAEGPVGGELERFVKWTEGAEAAELMSAHGYLPVGRR